MNKQIISRAPLRLGLAGGGTDLQLFSKSYGGNIVNLTIKKYIYCKIIPIKTKHILFESQDQNKITKYYFKEKRQRERKFHQNFLLENIYKYIRDKYNRNKNFPVKIITYSEVPSGSGLGGSSTLVVTVISALLKYLNKKISKEKLAKEAVYIERNICKIPGGLQDQYAAVYGGLNFIIFKKKGFSVVVKKIKYKKNFLRLLESSIILFFYNKKRISSKVINNQNKNIINKNYKTIAALIKLKKEAINLKKSIEKNNYKSFINTLKRGWIEKQKTSKFITNKKIIKIEKEILRSGADSVKVSGAGGGGFFFILSKLENRSKIIKYLKKQNGILTETCNITLDGVETWDINEKRNSKSTL